MQAITDQNGLSQRDCLALKEESDPTHGNIRALNSDRIRFEWLERRRRSVETIGITKNEGFPLDFPFAPNRMRRYTPQIGVQ
jgi:hypothetical protein